MFTSIDALLRHDDNHNQNHDNNNSNNSDSSNNYNDRNERKRVTPSNYQKLDGKIIHILSDNISSSTYSTNPLSLFPENQHDVKAFSGIGNMHYVPPMVSIPSSATTVTTPLMLSASSSLSPSSMPATSTTSATTSTTTTTTTTAVATRTETAPILIGQLPYPSMFHATNIPLLYDHIALTSWLSMYYYDPCHIFSFYLTII